MSNEHSIHLRLLRILIQALLASAILFYDYLLTFSMEVERFWSRARSACPSLVSCGFVLNRYLSLFGNIPVLIEFYATRNHEVSRRAVSYLFL